MKALNVLIVEDNPQEAAQLAECLKALSYEVTGIADSLESALGLFYAQLPDVLIVDIMLHGRKDGIAIAEKLNDTPSVQRPVIFLTHLIDQETFDMARKTNPFNYLLKPYHPRELAFSIELAVERHLRAPGIFTDNTGSSALAGSELYFKKGNYLFKVPPSDIDHIEVEGKYSNVHTTEGRYLVQRSLRDLESELPASFCRIHRNYLVNLSRIKRVDMSYMEVELSNQKILPVSKTFRTAFLDRLQIIQ